MKGRQKPHTNTITNYWNYDADSTLTSFPISHL